MSRRLLPHSEGVSLVYRNVPGPLAVAHRGGAGLAAENTLATFDRSYALGFRCLETDVRVTADGELIAFHDGGLRRLTGTRGRPGDRTLAELDPLRVHDSGAIVSLTVLLATFPDAAFMIDIKDRAAVRPLARLLEQHRAAQRVCVAARCDSWVAELRALTNDRLSTALSWRALTRLVTSSRPLRPASAEYAHVPVRLGRVPVFADDLVARAHDSGVRVLVWTVNDPTAMHRLLDRGVDGIITDRPDLLREVLIARGQWHAPSDTAVSNASS